MNIADADSEFRSYLARHGKSLGGLLPEDLLTLGLDFFEQVRAADALPVTRDDFGDALLFQWGTREALPDYYEACLYLDLTRQFISKAGEDDDAMFQLTCQLQYPPLDTYRAIGAGNRWCASFEELPEFRTFALGHPAFMAVRGKVPSHVEFYLSGV